MKEMPAWVETELEKKEAKEESMAERLGLKSKEREDLTQTYKPSATEKKVHIFNSIILFRAEANSFCACSRLPIHRSSDDMYQFPISRAAPVKLPRT